MVIREFEVYTHALSNEEKNQFGIFISHSSKDVDLVNQLKDAMPKRKMSNQNVHESLVAEEFISGGEDFHKKIRECIHCFAGIIVLTRNALESNWVSYECGYFDGLKMPVLVWDKDNILSYNDISKDYLNVFLLQYKKVSTIEDVVQWIQNISIYSNLFNNNLGIYSKAEFDKIIDTKIETAIVKLTSNKLNGKRELFKGCTIGALVVNFGMFYSNQSNGLCCKCAKHLPLTNQKCVYSDNPFPCALIYSEEEQKEKMPDCIILNNIIKCGKYFDTNDTYHDGSKVKEAMLSFYLPVHKYYGTEFKFIVDTPTREVHKELFSLFKDMKLNPTLSNEPNDLRIFLSLEDRAPAGLFRLNDNKYYNNFLCPHAIKVNRK